jgi:competence protein ComEA
VPTANERKALWFLALVAFSGTGVRLWRAHPPPVLPTESAALNRQIQRAESVRATRSVRTQRPVTPVSPDSAREPVDLDRASAAEIEALPGIGPLLAKRIVANRDSVGAFGRLDALCDVRGIGPALIERLRPLVTFTGARRPLSDECGGASKRPSKKRPARSRERR